MTQLVVVAEPPVGIREQIHGSAGQRLEVCAAVAHLPLRGHVVDPGENRMGHGVRPDRHAGARERAHLLRSHHQVRRQRRPDALDEAFDAPCTLLRRQVLPGADQRRGGCAPCIGPREREHAGIEIGQIEARRRTTQRLDDGVVPHPPAV